MKAKKIVNFSQFQGEKNVKAVMALVVLALAFGIFLLFINYKENIITTGVFQVFIVMTFLFMALLFGLLYLVGKK